MIAAETDPLSWTRILIACLTLIGLLGTFAVALRYFASKGILPGKNTGKKRLDVLESLAIDPRRRLVIIRFDETEHLLLLGPNQDTVIAEKKASPLTPADPRE